MKLLHGQVLFGALSRTERLPPIRFVKKKSNFFV